MFIKDKMVGNGFKEEELMFDITEPSNGKNEISQKEN